MPSEGTASLPLGHLRVIELSRDPAGDLAGKLLGDLGADVVKLEDPAHPGLRDVGPFAGDKPGPERSLSFAYYNAGKRSAILDEPIETSPLLEELLSSADILISTCHPRDHPGLRKRYEALCERHGQLIIVAITPFGLDGPWRDWRASDLVTLALGGPLHTCGYDDHTLPPIRPGGNQGFHLASTFAHLGVLLALIDREKSGRGQVVDVAMHECAAVTIEMGFPYWSYQHTLLHRQTCRHAQPVPTQPILFRCRDDRYVCLVRITNENKSWANMVEWLAEHDFAIDLQDADYSDPIFRQSQSAHIQDILEAFILTEESETVLREGQARGLPFGILKAPEELLTDGHLEERGFFQVVATGEFGDVRYPGPPYRFDRLDWRIRGRAPILGGATAEMLESTGPAGQAPS
jgi:benzylsuccinate CoA-transferase BbsE subunit